MKRHKSTSPMLRNWDLSFWTPVNFEVEYFINEETEGVLTDTVPSVAEWSKALESDANAGGESPVGAPVRAATLCPNA